VITVSTIAPGRINSAQIERLHPTEQSRAAVAPEALVLMLAGMVMIGIGAALAHPQLSGAMLALTPPDRAGMASAVTIVARQGGFALGIAALAVVASGQAGVSVFAVAAAVAGMGASPESRSACRVAPQPDGRPGQ
jgi:MFS family permease